MEISIVKDLSEAKECYRLRFNVFSLEENDNRYAINGEFKDSIDSLTTTLCICKYNDITVGTTRAYPLIILDEALINNYKLEMLPFESIPTDRIYIFDRHCVKKEYRNKGISSKMDKFNENKLPKGTVIISAISIDKKEWIDKYILKGYTKYSSSTYNGWTGVNLFKVV